MSETSLNSFLPYQPNEIAGSKHQSSAHQPYRAEQLAEIDNLSNVVQTLNNDDLGDHIRLDFMQDFKTPVSVLFQGRIALPTASFCMLFDLGYRADFDLTFGFRLNRLLFGIELP